MDQPPGDSWAPVPVAARHRARDIDRAQQSAPSPPSRPLIRSRLPMLKAAVLECELPQRPFSRRDSASQSPAAALALYQTLRVEQLGSSEITTDLQ